MAALAIVGAVVVTACGSEDAAPVGTDAPRATEAASTDSTDVDGATVADGSTTGDGADEDAGDEAFPVTIDHKFGQTTIETEPMRVVSVGFNEHDFLLALGVTPVGLRDWYGDQPNGVWPWAQDELGDATPAVIAPDAINFEQVAALEPDLIVGVWSGMTAEDYELLAAIAPTVAQPDTYDDFGTPWQEQTEILGRATGRTEQAESVVAEIEAEFAAVREAHPEWAGQEASVAFVFEGNPGTYVSQDTRSRILVDLGFSIPEINDSAGDDSFYLELTPEDIEPLDVDLLVWTSSTDEEVDLILEGLPTRSQLDVVQQGREVFADAALTGAFSHGSPLSLEFALDALVPEIEAAVDGDPATVVPSAAEVGAADADTRATTPEAAAEDTATEAVGEGGDDAATAAAGAWSTVFDSTIPFEEKSAFLEDPDALVDAVQAYADAGAGFGGIGLSPTAVAVDGETATVTYDVLFGENPAYSDQSGTIQLVDGVWTVSRDEFCAFMSSARVSC
ncbi:MAG: iron-siderophore ABC transporter substrate-binding protein [Ilumatobacter sp.]|uniref:iron-siderophore ABC transporter substrate-binding protein n=1 Tax=Ilumatobacter sp. TaxID=1967498 RepID=UPI003297AA4A